jgi:hypothetical protein
MRLPHPACRASRLGHAVWLTASVSLACSAPAVSSAPTTRPAATVRTEPDPAPDMATSAELGGLNEREAEQSFRASLDGLQECVQSGVERLSFMGGSIEFAVKVDTRRQVARVWAAESSLGERATEKCMFEALRAVAWPAPVGGAFGIARNSFEFEPKKGAPAPAVWDAGRVAEVVSGADAALAECRGSEQGRLLVTLYIGEGGKALAGGAASEEPVDEDAVDCVVNALLAADYPLPERSPTKVRFQL